MDSILVIENYAGSHLGAVAEAMAEAGRSADVRLMYRGDPLPDGPGDHAGLIILGGAQDALADDTHPYLPKVVELTRAFAAADKAVLGICLGSQIVARAFGGRNVIGGRPLEIGWREVTPTAAGRSDPVIAALGEGAPMFHWHFDTFDLPAGAVHLASSALTPNQAFRIGDRVYALQFHFEANAGLVSDWRDAYGEALRAVGDSVPDLDDGLARLAPVADRVGLAIARAWLDLAYQSPSVA